MDVGATVRILLFYGSTVAWDTLMLPYRDVGFDLVKVKLVAKTWLHNKHRYYTIKIYLLKITTNLL